MLFAHISDQKHTSIEVWPFKGKQDAVEFFFEEIQRTLPSTNYLIISTPILPTDGNGFESCIARVDQFAGVLRSVIGNGLFREIVREGTVRASDGDMQSSSRMVRMPNKCEGEKIAKYDWDRSFDLLKAIEGLNDDLINRVSLATQLFEEAARADNPTNFFLYWVSIEVLCDTHNAWQIVQLLRKAYNMDNEFIKNKCGLHSLIRLRQDVFHSGRKVNLDVQSERYIQLVFSDLLNAILGRSCERYIEHYVDSGFDPDTIKKGGSSGVMCSVSIDKKGNTINIIEH